MENEEVFKPIEGFEDYEISNHGNVKSLKSGVIMKSRLTANGYLILNLSKNGNHYRFLVHRLVAIAFIPNPNNLPCVNHKDENKLNNHVDNLEWCDYKYNINYGTAIERRSEKRRGKKLSEETKEKLSSLFRNRLDMSKQVVAINEEGEIVMEFASTQESGRNGFDPSSVSKCCNGKLKTHGGYHWYYKEEWLKIIENK